MAFVFRQGDLPKLDLQVDRGADFQVWKAQWDVYISLSGLDKQAQSKHVQALTLCLSRETVTIVDNLGLTDTQRSRGNVKTIIEAIQTQVEGQINESVKHRNFRRRSQQQGKTFDDFLAKTCKFCSEDCTQKNIRDQIIEGLVDGEMVEELLKEKDLTLEKIIGKCQAQETAKKQRAVMATGTLLETTIQAIRKPRPTAQMTQTTQTCPGCGGRFHQGGRNQSPAYNMTCHNCRRLGHPAKVCRGRWISPPTPPAPNQEQRSTMALYTQTQPTPHISASKSNKDNIIDPAPTIGIQITFLNRNAEV